MKDWKKLPTNLKFFLPILNEIKTLGGSGNASEIKDAVYESQNITEEELSEKFKSGVSKIDNRFAWGKVYLVKAGLMEANDDVWSLTEKGLSANLTEQDTIAIFKRLHKEFATIRNDKQKQEDANLEDKEIVFSESYKLELLEILQNLSPDGFERLCQRILRESGFKKVLVKGKSGDGGIDGEGILEINPLVSLKVIFQSKRYRDSVSSGQIRDFRGAMQGRAEKGIFITTGRFTKDAKIEAYRDGAPPIELVDSEKLIYLCEQKEIGLKPKMTFEVDEEFFEEFK